MPYVPSSTGEMDPADASFQFRRHLSRVHRFPAGYSYLIPREELTGFHVRLHRAPNRAAARLLIRLFIGQRRRDRRAVWEARQS